MCGCRECYPCRERVLLKGTEMISKAVYVTLGTGNKGNIYHLARVFYFN